jgi:hypothetical protein
MVDRIVMQEFPDAAGRLGKAGVPWLFEYRPIDPATV